MPILPTIRNASCHASAIFRISNTTENDIVWSPKWYYSVEVGAIMRVLPLMAILFGLTQVTPYQIVPNQSQYLQVVYPLLYLFLQVTDIIAIIIPLDGTSTWIH